MRSGFMSGAAALRDLHSFPTRRSSDLGRMRPEHEPYAALARKVAAAIDTSALSIADLTRLSTQLTALLSRLDRKSTRLNSSHVEISYAVFCLKKKKDRARARRI